MIWVINYYFLEKVIEFIRKYYYKDIYLEGMFEDDLNFDVILLYNFWIDLFKLRYIKRIILVIVILIL